MKKLPFLLCALVFSMLASPAAQAQAQYVVKNEGAGTSYLFHDFKNGKVICQSGEDAKESAAAIWQIELVGGTSHTFRLKNTAKDEDAYLQVQTGTQGAPLICGVTDKKARAAMFIFQQVDSGSGRIRLRSSAFLDFYACFSGDRKAVVLRKNPAIDDDSCKWLVEEVE